MFLRSVRSSQQCSYSFFLCEDGIKGAQHVVIANLPLHWLAPAIVERSRGAAQDAASKKWLLFTLLSHRREPRYSTRSR